MLRTEYQGGKCTFRISSHYSFLPLRYLFPPAVSLQAPGVVSVNYVTDV